MITALLAGSGLLTVLPAQSVSDHLEAGLLRALPINLDVHMEDFGIIRRHDQPLSPAATHLLEALRATARGQRRQANTD